MFRADIVYLYYAYQEKRKLSISWFVFYYQIFQAMMLLNVIRLCKPVLDC